MSIQNLSSPTNWFKPKKDVTLRILNEAFQKLSDQQSGSITFQQFREFITEMTYMVISMHDRVMEMIPEIRSDWVELDDAGMRRIPIGMYLRECEWSICAKHTILLSTMVKFMKENFDAETITDERVEMYRTANKITCRDPIASILRRHTDLCEQAIKMEQTKQLPKGF